MTIPHHHNYITRFLCKQVEIISEDDPPLVIDVMRAGQIFGEVSLIANMPRRVTARARNHVDLLCLSKEDLDEVLHHYPVLQAKMHEAAQVRFGSLLKEFAHRFSITPNT
jgi:CRP-like cAMP-binding protein